jgi:lipopolysaccharide biosynthesis glycosyltransferase
MADKTGEWMAPPPGERPVTVVTVTDANLIPHIEVVAISMVAAAKTDRPVEYHILYNGENSAAVEKLGAFHHGPVRIIMHFVDNPMTHLGGLRHLTPATFLRFVVPDHITAPKAAYIDSDIVILDDIAEFFDIDLHGAPLGAIQDPAMWRFRDQGVLIKTKDFEGPSQDYLARFLPPEAIEGYINAGILLMDLEQWRAHGYGQRGEQIVSEWDKRLLFRDQDTINMMFYDKMVAIDPRWNAISSILSKPLSSFAEGSRRELVRRQQAAPGLVHFTAGEKPWLRSAHIPYASYWWVMAEHSQFYSELKAGHRALMRQRRAIPLSLPGPLTYWRASKARQRLIAAGLPVRK